MVELILLSGVPPLPATAQLGSLSDFLIPNAEETTVFQLLDLCFRPNHINVYCATDMQTSKQMELNCLYPAISSPPGREHIFVLQGNPVLWGSSIGAGVGKAAGGRWPVHRAPGVSVPIPAVTDKLTESPSEDNRGPPSLLV